LLEEHGNFGYYRESVYCNKRNMVFYRGSKSLMNHGNFIEEFGSNIGRLL
jgi:hypothetical protein